MRTQQSKRKATAASRTALKARKKLLKAHRKGERGLENLAQSAGRGERQTSRYLQEHGLSAATDPVDAAICNAEALDSATVEQLSAMGAARHPSMQPRHTTHHHLAAEIDAAVDAPVTLLDEPDLVFEPVEGDGWVHGASKIGEFTSEFPGPRDVLLVHDRDNDGVDRYPNAGTELTAYWYILPEHPQLISEEGFTSGVVVARSLEDAAAAVAGVRPVDGNLDGEWDRSRCRFAEHVEQWQAMVDAQPAGNPDDPDCPSGEWVLDSEAVGWVGMNVSDEHPTIDVGVSPYAPLRESSRERYDALRSSDEGWFLSARA